MLRAKTVFVLGAGASHEVGLPVGSDLLKQIANLIDIKHDHGGIISGDRLLSQALKILLNEGRSVEEYNAHLHAAWTTVSSASQALSIDNIVDGLEDEKIEKVAKLGIVRAILKAESGSPYFKPPKEFLTNLNWSRFEDTWYDRLTKLLCENRKLTDIENVFQNLAFVSFNYDRCIEAYLPRSIANYFGTSVDEVVEIFKEVKIHRPYGIAGEITGWRKGVPIGFGDTKSAQYLAESSLNIRTFTQGMGNSAKLNAMRAELQKAETIVFLGSAFHDTNVELLECKISRTCKIFATSGNISNPDLEVIDAKLNEVFSLGRSTGHGRIEFASMYCKEFFDTYWRSLSAMPRRAQTTKM